MANPLRGLPALLAETAPATATAAAPGHGRPLGVTILAALDGLVGVFLVLGGVAAATLGSVASALFLGWFGFLGAAMFAMMGAVMVGLGLVFLAVAWGYWTGQAWAWTVSLVLVLLGVVLALLSLLNLDAGAVVSLLIDAFLLWYLTREGVQRWFGKVGAWPAPQVDTLLGRIGAPK